MTRNLCRRSKTKKKISLHTPRHHKFAHLLLVCICRLWLTHVTIQGGETFRSTIVQVLNPSVYHHVHFDSVVYLECTFILDTSVRTLTCFQADTHSMKS